ncbi:MAG: hypothetical protein KDD51_03710 [Bdellovibrionales bacterium]|nr:hypothetical protein [Bdellovibrionales bacterium]
MRKVVSAILLLGMVWGETFAASQWPCVLELYGSPYGFSYVLEPPRAFSSSWITVAGRPYVLELPTVSNPVPLAGQPPIHLRGSTIVRGQYDFDTFEARYREFSQFRVGQLYLSLLGRLGALIAHTNKNVAQEYFTLMILNRRTWHEVPLNNLALYSASQFVESLPSLTDFFAVQRQNGGDNAKTEREFLLMILEALEKIRPQLVGAFDPLEHVLTRVRDEHRFHVLAEDRSILIEEGMELFEFDAKFTPTESEPVEFQLTVEKKRDSHLWDESRAPFLLLDFALYDDYLDVFANQSALLVHVAGPRSLVPARLQVERAIDDLDEEYYFASTALAIEFTPQQAALFLDFIRQFRNFGLELIPI